MAFSDIMQAIAQRLASSPADPDGALAQADVPSGDLLAHVGGGLAKQGLGPIMSAVTAPRDAYTGALQVWDPATGHTSDAAAGRAGEMAGLAMSGALPMPAPAGSLRMFAGRNAATADHAALSKAEELLASGADRQAVWDQTGWFKGADGKLRYEISDDAAKIGNRAADELLGPRGETSGKAAGVIWHKGLYDAYPALRGTDVHAEISHYGGGNRGGSYMPSFGAGDAASISIKQSNLDGIRSTALHELQHDLQAQEGFARGASAHGLSKGTPAWDIYQEKKAAAVAPPSREEWIKNNGGDAESLANFKEWEGELAGWRKSGLPDYLEKALQEGAAMEAYRRSAGEVEARNVQTRRDFTQEQRRATPPWVTQDVPDAEQIIRR